MRAKSPAPGAALRDHWRIKRIVAIAAALAALGFAACGDDEETPAESQGETTATTTVSGDPAAESPTAPESANDPSSGAPDEGISEKPGGSESSGGGY